MIRSESRSRYPKVAGAVPALAAVLFLLLLAMPASTSAQTQMELGRLSTGEALTYSGKCEDAVKLLRPLYEKYPTNSRIINSLKNAYVCAKQADSAIAILERQVDITVIPLQKQDLYLEIAGIRLRQGEKESAERLLSRALQIAPEEMRTFEKIANTYMSGGYYSDAVRFLQQTRESRNDPYLFNRKLAQLFEIMRNYGDAASEYYRLALVDSSQARYVEGRINHLIRLDADEEFDTGLGESLGQLVTEYPDEVLALRVYGTYLVAQGRLEEAYERFITVDSLGSGDGADLLRFAEMARDRGNHELVEKACTRIELLPQSPYVTQAHLILAQSHFNAHRYDQAAAIYRKVVETSPDKRAVADALYALAYTKFKGLQQPDSAMVVLEELYNRFGNMPIANQGLIIMADCLLAMNEPQAADSLYHSIEMRRLPVDAQEQLEFKKAELQFLLGNYPAARDAYSGVMNAFPKSIYVNDALRRIMLITEHEGMDQVNLKLLSDALLATRQFEADTALQKLSQLKQRGTAMLKELAYLESGKLLQELEEYNAALAEYEALVAVDSTGFYAPIALELQGDIYSNQIKDCAKARETYEKVLLDYSDSLNSDAVRRKLNRVERYLCSPEDTKS